MQTLTQIQVAMTERLEALRPAKDEYERLERAIAALDSFPPIETPAPHGVKADGTPRKRSGRPRGSRTAKGGSAVKSNGSKRGQASATLRVTTPGPPSVNKDSEPVYVTQE